MVNKEKRFETSFVIPASLSAFAAASFAALISASLLSKPSEKHFFEKICLL